MTRVEGTTIEGSALQPTRRVTAFDPPPGIDGAPIARLTMAGGGEGWLVNDYTLVREILADGRFSVDRRRAQNPIREIPEEMRNRQDQPGMFLAQNPPAHTRYRKLLTGQFTVRRMRELTGMIESYVDERLDAMETAGKPVDLVEEFALPVPSRVICELLGVDYTKRAEFQERTARLLRLDTKPEDMTREFEGIQEFMLNLVRDKRTQDPDNDMITGLIAADPTLTDEELSNMGMLLLLAGHETTANMLGLGTFALLSHPDQLERLRADPELLPGAVEELRYLTIIQFGTIRVAQEDVQIGGVTIAEGETAVLYIPLANRDPEHFERPDELDVTRQRVRHVGFGHGIHQCLGQQLARVEMVTAWARLFERFPNLRLACEPQDVPLRTDMGIYGVHKLPVTW